MSRTVGGIKGPTIHTQPKKQGRISWDDLFANFKKLEKEHEELKKDKRVRADGLDEEDEKRLELVRPIRSGHLERLISLHKLLSDVGFKPLLSIEDKMKQVEELTKHVDKLSFVQFHTIKQLDEIFGLYERIKDAGLMDMLQNEEDITVIKDLLEFEKEFEELGLFDEEIDTIKQLEKHIPKLKYTKNIEEEDLINMTELFIAAGADWFKGIVGDYKEIKKAHPNKPITFECKTLLEEEYIEHRAKWNFIKPLKIQEVTALKEIHQLIDFDALTRMIDDMREAQKKNSDDDLMYYFKAGSREEIKTLKQKLKVFDPIELNTIKAFGELHSHKDLISFETMLGLLKKAEQHYTKPFSFDCIFAPRDIMNGLLEKRKLVEPIPFEELKKLIEFRKQIPNQNNKVNESQIKKLELTDNIDIPNLEILVSFYNRFKSVDFAFDNFAQLVDSLLKNQEEINKEKSFLDSVRSVNPNKLEFCKAIPDDLSLDEFNLLIKQYQENKANQEKLKVINGMSVDQVKKVFTLVEDLKNINKN